MISLNRAVGDLIASWSLTLRKSNRVSSLKIPMQEMLMLTWRAAPNHISVNTADFAVWRGRDEWGGTMLKMLRALGDFFMLNVTYMVHPIWVYPAAEYVRNVYPRHKWFSFLITRIAAGHKYSCLCVRVYQCGCVSPMWTHTTLWFWQISHRIRHIEVVHQGVCASSGYFYGNSQATYWDFLVKPA
jgi:hypothetical protein